MEQFSRLIPRMDDIKRFRNPLTDGELCLIKYLDDNLSIDIKATIQTHPKDYNGWLIFVQPFLNGTRPDVIIFNPRVGMVIYEVKDWDLNNYSYHKDNKGRQMLYVINSKGEYPIKSPGNQVECYKDIIVSQLVSQIGELIDNNIKCEAVIKTAIYFHKASTINAQRIFNSKAQSIFKYIPVFGYDSLNKDNLEYIAPDVNKKGYYWNKKWNEEILFWITPPLHSIEQGTNLKLNGQQRKIAELHAGHHRIRGVAGSGKTMVLAYRAALLASQNLDVLVLTYNLTLCHYIRDLIKRCPIPFKWDKITISYFHGFCKNTLNKLDTIWPNQVGNVEDFFERVVPNEVSKVEAQLRSMESIFVKNLSQSDGSDFPKGNNDCSRCEYLGICI